MEERYFDAYNFSRQGYVLKRDFFKYDIVLEYTAPKVHREVHRWTERAIERKRKKFQRKELLKEIIKEAKQKAKGAEVLQIDTNLMYDMRFSSIELDRVFDKLIEEFSTMTIEVPR